MNKTRESVLHDDLITVDEPVTSMLDSSPCGPKFIRLWGTAKKYYWAKVQVIQNLVLSEIQRMVPVSSTCWVRRYYFWCPIKLRNHAVAGKLCNATAIFHPGFDRTGNSTIQSADHENPTQEPNMKWIRWPLVEIWSLEIRHFTTHKGCIWTGLELKN